MAYEFFEIDFTYIRIVKLLSDSEYSDLQRDARMGRNANKPDNSGDGCMGLLIGIAVIVGLIIYYPMKWYKEWTYNTLEYQINVDVANFRAGPSKESRILRKAKRGETFMELTDSSISATDSMWIRGFIGQDTGWIYRDLLEQDIWK